MILVAPAFLRGRRSFWDAPPMTVFAASNVTFVVGGVLYLILLITLGVLSIRKGHWVMFIIGLFFPLFWIIGAVLPLTASARAAR